MSNSKCIHCGEECGKYPVEWNGKIFCCHGCLTVYQLLDQNRLYKYYEIENNPGIKVEQPDFDSKYAYLDNEEIKDKLIDFSDGEISKITLYIPSIHCSSCIWLLEHLHSLNPAILQSTVNFIKKEVTLIFKHQQISLRKLVELLVSIHYIPQITLEQFDRKKSEKSNRKLIYKIGIAGFVFGNIMLLSMPQYIPGKELVEEKYSNYFLWISLILSLPIVIYCSEEYLLTAFKNLRQKIININLPIAIGILALFIQSSWHVIEGEGSVYFDSLSGLVFFLLLGRWYQNKTYQALSFDRDYKSYFPVAVTKITDNKEISIPLKDIKAGDKILLHNQELIPADSVLMKGEAFIDYSFVTGESNPIKKDIGNALFAGGRQIGQAIEIEITKEVEQSQLTKLWNQENILSKEDSNLKMLI